MYKGCGCSIAVGGSLPGDMIFQVAVGNFCVVHHGPAKKPLTHPHCWTWAQPPWAILTPNPHNLHLHSLLLLSLHFQVSALSDQDRSWRPAGCWLSLGWLNLLSPFSLAGDTRDNPAFQKEVTSTASDGGTEDQCYRSHIQRSWQPTVPLLLEIRPFLLAAVGISSCRWILRAGSQQINAINPFCQLMHPVSSCIQHQGRCWWIFAMGEKKKSPNNFAIPVLSLEHFCCSLQAQNPGNALGGAKGNSGFSHAGITLPQQM